MTEPTNVPVSADPAGALLGAPAEYPPASPAQRGLFGFVEMVLFIGTVFVAYAYVWRRGGLDWD